MSTEEQTDKGRNGSAAAIAGAGVICGGTLETFEPSLGVMLAKRAAERGDAAFLRDKASGTQEYQEHSWNDIFDEIVCVGANFLKSGVRPGDRLAILSENRREMLVAEFAAMSIGALSVPIFAGYYPHQIEYILNQSGACRLAVSTPQQLMKLTQCKNISCLKQIVLMDYDPHELQIDSLAKIPVKAYAELRAAPTESEKQLFFDAVEQVSPQDSCLIMYTSGTTGMPKGVELCHGNLLSQQRAIQQLWSMTAEDRFLSYLPWHHSFGGLFERMMATYSGACIALDESGGKNFATLLANWRKIMPTVFFSIPSVFQRIADEVRIGVVRETIFHPDLRFVFTAAAPLPQDVSDIFSAAGISVLEGWGLTETSPCVTLTDPDSERVPGVVGWPIPGVQVMLADDGEILVKGPNVMRGYYDMAEENEKTFTAEGWFRTGDLGEVCEGGMRILGRRDGCFKLLNAEKVFASQIEMALVGGSQYIDQAVIFGSGEHYVTALVYPNRRSLEQWARSCNLPLPDNVDLSTVSDVRRLFASEVQRINGEIAGRFQRVHKFVIMNSALTLEKGELTPTSKIVRHKIRDNNQKIVEDLYKVSCPPPSKSIICLGDCY
jgi:long-subunit acyl-CoA synthetase (AMP-forming)